MTENDEVTLRARRVRKTRERKGSSRWLEKRTAGASSRRPALAIVPGPALVTTTVPLAPAPAANAVPLAPAPAAAASTFDDDDAQFFVAGDEQPATAYLDLDLDDEDEPATATRSPEVAAIAAARRRSFSRHVLGIVGVAVVLCIAALVRSATGVPALAKASAATSLVALPAPVLPAVSAAAAVPAPPPAAVEAPFPSAPVAAAEPAPAEPAPAEPAPATTSAALAAASSATAAREEARRFLDNGAGEAAIAAGRRSVQLDATDAEAWLILGAAYQLVGKGAEARTAFFACSKKAKRGPVGECSALLL